MNPPPRTEAECVATLIDCSLSAEKYRKICRRANRKGHRVFHGYKRTTDYKNKHCLPKNIDASSSELSIHVNLQDILDHQTSKVLTMAPEIKEKMKVLASQGASFELHVKYGRSFYTRPHFLTHFIASRSFCEFTYWLQGLYWKLPKNEV